MAGLDCANAEYSAILEPLLSDIDKLIIATGIRGEQKETGIDDIADGVIHDAFHNLAVLKLNSDPDAVHDSRTSIEFQIVMAIVALKALYKEDRLRIACRNLLDNPRVKSLNTKYFGMTDRGVAQ